MSDTFERTSDIDERKSEIVKVMTDVEFFPFSIEEQTCLKKFTKMPLSQVTILGTAFEPLTEAFQNFIDGSGSTSGLYKVTIPKGGRLAEFKNGSGYLGSVLKENGAVGGGQAVLNPLVCNPTMLFMAATLATINKKLDNIQETQQEILDFLVQKERSELRGNLNFLTEVLNDYKYNWNSVTFKNVNYNIAREIKRKAEGKIDFYKAQITTKIKKTSIIHSDQWVKKQLNNILSEFKDYQLALYLYSFSSFLEIILLENFESAYLNATSKKIEDYSLEYHKIYTQCHDQIEGYAQSSIQSYMIKGFTSASSGIGDSLVNKPNLGKLLVGGSLKISSKVLENKGSERTKRTMKQFIEKQDDYIRPFVEEINTVNKLYNQSTELIFDKENIYIGTSEVQ